MFFKVQYREMGDKGRDLNTLDDDIAPPSLLGVNGLKAISKYRFHIAAVRPNNDNKLTFFKESLAMKPINCPVIINFKPVNPSDFKMKWDCYIFSLNKRLILTK